MLCAGLEDLKCSHVLNHLTLAMWAEIMTSYLLLVKMGKMIWSELFLLVCVHNYIHTYTSTCTKTYKHMHPLQRFCYSLQWEKHFICVKANWWQTRNKLQFLAPWLPCRCPCQYISLGNACSIANVWALWKTAESVLNQPPRQIFPLFSI